MKKILINLLLLYSSLLCCTASKTFMQPTSLIQPIYQKIKRVWTEGENELYISGYAWHNRYIYPRNKIKHYNELAWGGGGGKGYYDEKGNWQGLYAFAFLDSHKNWEPAVGYAFLKVLPLDLNTSFGVGYSVLFTSRPDIAKGLPFPGILPWTALRHKALSVCATYIPSFGKNGNVLFLVAKWTL